MSAGFAKEGEFRGRAAKDGLVVAVAVEEKLRAVEAAGYPFGAVCGEPVGEEPNLRAELLSAGIGREELEHFIPEN